MTSSKWQVSKWLLVSFFIPFLVYIATMSDGLTRAHYGADGGELIAAAVTLGIPHPPGYPTYVVLGKLFSFLPIDSIVTRFNLLSAVTISAAAALITLIHTQSDPHKRWVNVLPALIFAFTAVIWSQAIITEVYGLNLLMIALFLWAIHKKRPFFIGLFLGLSISTHLTSLFSLPLAVIGVYGIESRPSGAALRGLLVGLSPFLLLPLFARGDSPIVWGDPTTFRGWIWLISGELYHPNAFGVGLTAVYPRITSWLREGMWQVLILVPLALIGIKQRHLQLATYHLPLTLLLTAVITLLYAFTYRTDDAIILVLPAVLLLAVLLPRSKWLLPVPILLLLLNFNAISLHNVPPSRPQAAQLLQTAPDDAILLTEGDLTIFDLWYYQQAEGIRPDLLLVDADLFAFTWYRARLGRLHPELKALVVDDLDAFERENDTFKVKENLSADYAD